ncbi:MAG: radical SAM family heme chaperone HemW [Elusimicrobia bacterium]|nr:radical SAM family heme chaperone HemW [Elusimicrobiota bacterium]
MVRLSAVQPGESHTVTGLYIHIPFCGAKCHYCHFASFPGRLAEIPRTLAALHKEFQAHQGETIETLFVGGGTPTVLSPAQWRTLMGSVRQVFTLAPEVEATTEANPESAAPEVLSALRELGFNRLSLGLQAAQDRLLKRIGRRHSYAQFETCYRAARSAGFQNVNFDLMYGLPSQTLADWRETLDRALSLNPEHVSAYALTVEEATAFAHEGVEADDDLQADMYEAAADAFESAGYVHYEISNFARPGFECRHNLRYWRSQSYVGAGVSAAGYENGVRRKNTEDLTRYLSAMETGGSVIEEEVSLPEPERVGEELMLSLRLREGIKVSQRAMELYGDVLRRYRSLGFLTEDHETGVWRPTRKGWRLSNRLFQELLTPSA